MRNGIDIGALDIKKPAGNFMLTPCAVDADIHERGNLREPENVRRSDRQARMLSDEQIEFACIFGFCQLRDW